MRGQISRYDQVARNPNFGSHRKSLAGVWVETKTPRARRLTAELAALVAPGGIQKLDLSPWLSWPGLYRPFADAFVQWSIGKSPRTRNECCRDLNRGWFAYLSSIPDSKSFELEHITTSVLNGFIIWLDQSKKDGSERWKPATRRTRFGALKYLIKELRKIPDWDNRLSSDLIIRSAPWINIRRLATPSTILSTPAWEQLYIACLKEIHEIKSAVTADWKLIEETTAQLPATPTGQGDYRDIGACLAEIARTFPSVVPARPEIYATNPHLDNAIVNYHSYTRVARPFHPRPRLLVPFVIMLCIYLQANGDLLLKMTSQDTLRQEVLGKLRLVWRRFKPRANAMVKRSFLATGDDDNPDAILRWLAQWTARIRAAASPDIQDRVFLFVPEWGEKKIPATFLPDRTMSSCSTAWRTNLKRFICDNKLPKITLRILRATGLDQTALLFNNDIRAVRAAGGQLQDQTVVSHYTSGGARARSHEKIGQLIELRNRWVDSSGRIDPRKRPPGWDLGSATSGWICLDPYGSPIEGQSTGQLCSAYGACPKCPLAQINLRSAYSLARLLQLAAAIEEAQLHIPAARWLSFWAPVLNALKHRWLPMFSDKKIIAAAKRLHLSELPPLE